MLFGSLVFGYIVEVWDFPLSLLIWNCLIKVCCIFKNRHQCDFQPRSCIYSFLEKVRWNTVNLMSFVLFDKDLYSRILLINPCLWFKIAKPGRKLCKFTCYYFFYLFEEIATDYRDGETYFVFCHTVGSVRLLPF